MTTPLNSSNKLLKYALYLNFKFSYPKNIQLFKPSDKVYMIWSVLNLILYLIVSYLISICIAFKKDLLDISNKIPAIGIVSVFLEIAKQLNTIYYNDGVSVKSRKKILQKYYNEKLLWDFMCILFLGLYYLFDYKIMNWLLLVFIFQIRNINKVIHQIENFVFFSKKTKSAILLMKLLFLILLMAHFLSCIWILVDVYNDSSISWII